MMVNWRNHCTDNRHTSHQTSHGIANVVGCHGVWSNDDKETIERNHAQNLNNEELNKRCIKDTGI